MEPTNSWDKKLLLEDEPIPCISETMDRIKLLTEKMARRLYIAAEGLALVQNKKVVDDGDIQHVGNFFLRRLSTMEIAECIVDQN